MTSDSLVSRWSGVPGLLYQAYIWPYLIASGAFWWAYGIAASPLVGPEAAWSVALNRWTRGNMRFGFYDCRVEGLEQAVLGSVIVSTHQGAFDVNVLAAVLVPPCFFVARKEVVRVPIVGRALRRGGHILIARGGGRENDAALSSAVDRLKRGARIVVFPEGTRSRDGSVGRFRSGAFRIAAASGCPVVPVAIHGTRDAMPAGSFRVVPARVAVSFLPARAVSEGDARSEAFRESTRAELVKELERLGREAGPRI